MNEKGRVLGMQRYREYGIERFFKEEENGKNCFSMMVCAGDRIYISGQGGYDLDGNFHGKDDPGVQADQACKNIKLLLEEQGFSLTDICKMRVYVRNRDYRLAVYSAIAENFTGVYPCSTGLVVKGLPTPEMLMQLDVEVHKPL